MKKGEIGNGTLAVLVIAALVVSIVGTFVLSSKLSMVSFMGTGFVANNQSGQVNLTIDKTISINLTDTGIDFGSGIINTGISSGSCDSADGTQINNSFNGNGCNTTTEGDKMSIWNDGNVMINISVNSTHNAMQFFCEGNTSNCAELITPLFQYKAAEGDSRCSISAQTTYADLVNATATDFCMGLPAQGNYAQNVNLSIYIYVPSDATTGLHQATIWYWATETAS